MTSFLSAQADPHHKRDLVIEWLVRERPWMATLAVACWLCDAGNEARWRQLLIEGAGPFHTAPDPNPERMRAALGELYA